MPTETTIGRPAVTTKESIVTSETIDRDRIARVFHAQRANRLALKERSAGERISVLARLRAEIVRRADDVDAALHADLRKERQGVDNFEVGAVLKGIDATIDQLEGWMKPEIVEPSPQFQGNETYILYEPRGVVLLLGPWNFAFDLVFSPLLPIIAAGNAVMIKPNELQPSVSTVVREIIEAVFPENEAACFEGGIPVAEALQELPFDHVFFTGSPAIGKRVMAAAAQHLSSVTLELGGKCPAILGPDYDIADASAKIAKARFVNAGQLCLAVDHVWVPRARQAELADALDKVITEMFYQEEELRTDRLSRIVDQRNFARVQSYIEEARAAGATIVRGGNADEATLTVHPTIILDPPLDARIMREEIFGPILPLIGYDDLDEVIDQVDLNGKPLAMYIFSHDQAVVDRLLNGTSSGGVTVNHVLMHFMETRLPFGGVNNSGMGRYRGKAGFQELSNPRSIFVYKN